MKSEIFLCWPYWGGGELQNMISTFSQNFSHFFSEIPSKLRLETVKRKRKGMLSTYLLEKIKGNIKETL